MTKKHILYTGLVALLALTLTLASCSKQSKPQGPQLTQYEQVLTARDTAAVKELVDNFFRHLELGEVADAVAMLYQMNDSNVYEAPEPLDNDQLQRLMAVYRSVPIVGHRIDYMKFNTPEDNEVKVTAIIAEAAEGRPELKTVYYLKPYDYSREWRLCVMRTEAHDRRIISNDQADSLQQRFSDAQPKAEPQQ